MGRRCNYCLKVLPGKAAILRWFRIGLQKQKKADHNLTQT